MSCGPKDCGCVIHEGPHWLHMDRVVKLMNLKLFERATRDASWLGLHAFAQAEQRRLETKLHEMKSHGLERHCPDEITAMWDDAAKALDAYAKRSEQ